MFAHTALRRAAAVRSFSSCARHNIPRHISLVRFNSTNITGPPKTEVAASSALSSNHAPAPSASTSKDLLASRASAPVEEALSHESAAEPIEEELEKDEFVDEENGLVAEHQQLQRPELTPEELKLLHEYTSQLTEADISSMQLQGRSMIEPLYHPKTHGIPAATLHLRSYWPPLLELFSHLATHSASALGIPISHPTPLPIKRNLWTVIRSPFVHKKSQENFERKTYKRVIKAWDADYEVVNRWVMYLEKNIVAGVGIRIVKWERAPVGVGKKVLDVVEQSVDPDHVLGGGHKTKIQALSAKIVQKELAAANTEPTVDQKSFRPAESKSSQKEQKPKKKAAV